MIIHVKQACEFTSKEGQKYRCQNGFIGTPPEWVEHDSFFKTLTRAGLITAHIDSKSVDSELSRDEKKKRS